MDCRSIDAHCPGPGFFCRETPLAGFEFPLVLEGPLHPATLEQVGLEATRVRPAEVLITGEELDGCQRLSYSRFTVRKIPPILHAYKDAFLFNSEDPL